MWRKLRAARRTKKPVKLWKNRESTLTELDIAQSTLVTPSTDIEPFSDGTESEGLKQAVAGDSEHQHVISAAVAEWEYDKGQDCAICPGSEQEDETDDRSLEQFADQATAEVKPDDVVSAEDSGVVDLEEQREEDAESTHPDLAADLAAEPQEECEIEDEEIARQAAYIQFSDGPGDPEDYTNGPARVVIASDGVKHCAALLMTIDLSERVRQSVQAQRDYAYTEAVTSKQQIAKTRFERKLKSAIRRHSRRIDVLRMENQLQDEVAVELKALQDEVEKLQMLQTETTAILMELKEHLLTEADNLRQIQASLTQCLEEAYIYAEAVDPPVEMEIPAVPELEVEEEYKKLCLALRESEGLPMEMTSAPASLHSCNELAEMVPATPEDQHRQDLIDAFYAAQNMVQCAQQDFDGKDDQRETELAAYQDAVARGEEVFDVAQEGFDLRWYTVYQDITRNLINAEEAFTVAKAAIVDAGLELLNDDAESGFGDVGSNGYAEEFEARMVATTNVPHVEGWLDNVADEASPDVDAQTDVDLDEWDAQNVEIGDSQSCVEYEPGWRRRIKKWRESCGLQAPGSQTKPSKVSSGCRTIYEGTPSGASCGSFDPKSAEPMASDDQHLPLRPLRQCMRERQSVATCTSDERAQMNKHRQSRTVLIQQAVARHS
ncbi:hypothetical protein LTS10_005421 [Elasticomyces elasticus]|nr:hypothetical protein LTS10_005421 [Elasticomyces elasticus]